jgi:hypothetical protein
MRWLKNRKEVPIKPKLGDIKICRKFLFFPLCLNEVYRWLEYAMIEYEYSLVKDWRERGYDLSEKWRPIKFVEKI